MWDESDVKKFARNVNWISAQWLNRFKAPYEESEAAFLMASFTFFYLHSFRISSHFRSMKRNAIHQSNERSFHLYTIYSRGARWLSGRVSDSGARGRGFETYRRRVVSLSKTLYSPKVLVNYPGSGGSVPTWLKIVDWDVKAQDKQTNYLFQLMATKMENRFGVNFAIFRSNPWCQFIVLLEICCKDTNIHENVENKISAFWLHKAQNFRLPGRKPEDRFSRDEAHMYFYWYRRQHKFTRFQSFY